MIAMADPPRSPGWGALTPRWTELRKHEGQRKLWTAKSRFRVVPCGRRSGKTELAKRFLVTSALRFHAFDNGLFVAAAPTRPQAKIIFWNDLKAMVPRTMLLDAPRFSISESELSIRLANGATLQVRGMDEPQRIEGSPLDGIVLDEYGNMKAQSWPEHVRPALSTIGRPGWAWMIGAPEGRNHYYDLAMQAKADTSGIWSLHHWTSDTILDPLEIAQARAELDERTFQQEYGGLFVAHSGQAYYPFEFTVHAAHKLAYQPTRPLIFCFDFNQAPGVAAVAQEFPEGFIAGQPAFTGIIGEVYIPQGSNTPRVCRKLAADWGKHQGDVIADGDATGGAGGSAKVMGSDWELIKQELRGPFGGRLKIMVPAQNPRERVRVNAVNARLRAADGAIRLRVDPSCVNVIKDFEGVTTIEGSAGDLDKASDPKLTHLSDAVGYYLHRAFPIQGHKTVVEYI